MKIKYRICEKEIDGRTVYGLEAVKEFSAVFNSKTDAQEFVNKCNLLELSEIHIEEVIDDYLQTV